MVAVYVKKLNVLKGDIMFLLMVSGHGIDTPWPEPVFHTALELTLVFTFLVYLFEVGSRYVPQAGLEVLGSNDQVSRTTGMHHCIWTVFTFLKWCKRKKDM